MAGRRCSPVVLIPLLVVGCSWEPELAYSQESPPRSGAAGAEAGTQPATDGSASPGGTKGTPASKHPANRLARETSPYLLLHAHNPVDWYPWGPEALEAARREQKPIFLSIGYSSCFWCHVMEREVFENAEIARYMNEHFINVKVDREERPDLDDVYMTAVQVYFQMAGSSQGGGWPLSMFLTPGGQPIAGGTYFPPKDMPGRPGFPRVLETVHTMWTTRRPEVEKSAELMAAEVRRIMTAAPGTQPVPLGRELIDAAVTACLEQYDPEYGGLDFHPGSPNRPKFPVPARLQLLQSQAGRPGSERSIQAVDHSLQAMAAGGIYDHLGGGFHRYSTDRRWRVPHFEKMLYDNAQLASAYTEAFQRTSRKGYRQTAEETLHFILRELTDPAGGFYSALDAETAGVEGAHYVWTRAEVEQRLGAADARIFIHAYGLDQPEFFEHGYVLLLPRPLAESAAQLKLAEAELDARLSEMRTRLLAVRKARPPLLKDDKVLTSWNGLAITAFAEAGRVFHRPDFIQAAEKAALFIATNLRDSQGRLQRTWRQGEAKLNAYLEDYAYLIQGLLALHEATGDPKWLHASRRLMDDQHALFWDETNKGFFFTSHEHEALLARTKDSYDSVLPSGNSVSVRNLVRMALVTGDDRYRDLARDTLAAFASGLRDNPRNMPYMALALQEYLAAFPTPGSAAVASPAPMPNRTPAPTPATTPPSSTPTPSSAATPTATAPATAGLSPWSVQMPDPTGKHKVQATLYVAANKLAAGKATPVACVIEISPGWHLNAQPPRPDFVIPTELTLRSTHGTTLSDVVYPEGHDFQVPGINEPVSVYEGRIVVYGKLQVPADAPAMEELTFTLRYQACNDQTCTAPQKVTLPGTIAIAPAGEQPQSLNAALFAPAAAPRPAP